MSLYSLQHVNIRTHKLAETVSFFEHVLGLQNGERPNFGFPGAWMYLPNSEEAVVHLIGEEKEQPHGSGSVDHVAFGAKGWNEHIARFEKLGYTFEKRDVPGRAFRQLFIRDPNGVLVELNFDTNEKA